MDSKDTDETRERLEVLSDMIRYVYLPLMQDKNKTDSKTAMERFVKSVKTSIQQAYGNITIEVPELPDGMQTEKICRDDRIISVLMTTIVSYNKFNFHPGGF